MAYLHFNRPPEYNYDLSHTDNFPRYLQWACSLRKPLKQIPEFGLKVAEHPLGFMAVYLSEPSGSQSAGRQPRGIVRANIYPAGQTFRDDIHSHGFAFESGVVEGGIINTMYADPKYWKNVPEGEGLIGYESKVDLYTGINRTVQATDAVIDVGEGTHYELSRGNFYAMEEQQFHSIAASDEGAITIFCKTPPIWGAEGDSLMLRPPNQSPPPLTY